MPLHHPGQQSRCPTPGQPRAQEQAFPSRRCGSFLVPTVANAKYVYKGVMGRRLFVKEALSAQRPHPPVTRSGQAQSLPHVVSTRSSSVSATTSLASTSSRRRSSTSTTMISKLYLATQTRLWRLPSYTATTTPANLSSMRLLVTFN